MPGAKTVVLFPDAICEGVGGAQADVWFVQHCAATESPFRLHGEPRGAACPAPLGDPPGHPATRPCGFAALLGLAGAGRTRRYAPQTGCRPLSCQSCATRPRKRDEPRCTLDHSSILRL